MAEPRGAAKPAPKASFAPTKLSPRSAPQPRPSRVDAGSLSRTVEGDGDWRAWRDPDAATRPLSWVVPRPAPPPPWGGARDSARAAAMGAGPARSRPPRCGSCTTPAKRR